MKSSGPIGQAGQGSQHAWPVVERPLAGPEWLADNQSVVIEGAIMRRWQRPDGRCDGILPLCSAAYSNNSIGNSRNSATAAQRPAETEMERLRVSVECKPGQQEA